MRRSLRWRLQLWYGLVLFTAVAVFACILYDRGRAARLHQVDAGLEAAALYIDATLLRFPPFELEGTSPDPGAFGGRRPPVRGGGDRPGGPGKGKPGPGREHMLNDLKLPPRNEGGGGDEPTNLYFAVWRGDGVLLKGERLPDGVEPPDPPRTGPPPKVLLRQRGEYREAAFAGPFGTRVLVGRSVLREQEESRGFAGLLAGTGAAVVAIGLAGGYWLSGRLLRPLIAISQTAANISATHLNERIDATRVDRELADLAGVLNAMFERLESAFERQARFTADASHELRTPLAVLRSHAELALSRPRSADDYRQTVETCLGAATRMTSLVEGLLTLARADAGKLDLMRQTIDLAQVVREALALITPLAAARGLSLQADVEPTKLVGDPLRLGQVVANLLGNAVQYNRPGGTIVVKLTGATDEALLTVTDTGCGIPVEDQPHIFERFYRVDRARSRAVGGSGLGLAICKSIIESHGGTIGFESASQQGSTFWVRLPTPGDVDDQ